MSYVRGARDGNFRRGAFTLGPLVTARGPSQHPVHRPRKLVRVYIHVYRVYRLRVRVEPAVFTFVFRGTGPESDFEIFTGADGPRCRGDFRARVKLVLSKTRHWIII